MKLTKLAPSILLLWVLLFAFARAQPMQQITHMQIAAAATGNGTAIDTGNASNALLGAVGVQITGTFVGTVTFEVNFDRVTPTWKAVMATNATDDVRATTATAPGVYSILLNGAQQCRARISAYTSGTITIDGRLTGGVISKASSSGGGGGGSGTVLDVAVASANGFAGTVANPTDHPSITISTSITGLLKGNGTAVSAASAGTDYESPLTFSTGLTRTTNTVTVNTSQNIATLSNLTSNGLVTTSGGAGTLGVTVPGTGVLTALGVNVGSTGAVVTFNGAGGTPSSMNATNLSGTAASLTAGAATVLATARTINGTSFNGSADITVTAAAGTLTGATLASGVTASSLTSFGAAPNIGAATATSLAVGLGGTANPTTFTVGDTSSSSPRGLMSWQSSTDAGSAHLHMRKSRGTFASPTVIVTADVLGRLVYAGYDGASFIESSYIRGISTGTIASTRVPSKLEFWTGTDAAPTVATLALTLGADQTATFAAGLSGTTATFSGAVNKVTITPPASSATLTIANTGSLITSGAFALTLTATATTNSTFPAGTDTLGGLGTAQTWTALQTFTSAATTGTGTTAGTPFNYNSLTTGDGLSASSSSVTTGNIVKITSTSTAAASNTLTGLNIAMSGANGTIAQTVRGAIIAVTNTNATSGTNTALTLTASGATTANNAINVTGGKVAFAAAGTFNTQQLIFNGGANTPSLYVDSSGVWTFRNESTGSDVVIDPRTISAAIGRNINVGADFRIAWNSLANASSGTNDLFLRRAAAASLALGATDVDTAPVAQSIQVQGALASGTSNVAGADWTFKGSPGKGTGLGGSIVFQVAPAGSSGTVVNSLVTGIAIAVTTAGAANPILQIGGTTTSFPGITFSGSTLAIQTATGSAFTGVRADSFQAQTTLALGAIAGDSFLTRAAAANIRHGAANAASPVAQTISTQGSRGGTDSNVSGANLTIQSGLGTGNSTPSSLILQSPLIGSTGTTGQTAVTGLTILNGTAVLTNYTVATLPSASVAGAGALAFVTDAVATSITGLGLTPVGGGSNKVVCYSDGTQWLII